MALLNNKKIRTRFAPSPTGFLHIGSARTALFNYIFAKQNKGVFILRVEDTDTERSKPEFEKDIIESLKWLGIQWDEFYKQSERKEICKKYLGKLLEDGKAYRCFCTEEELEAKKQYQGSIGQAPRYNGKCADLSEEEVNKNLKEGKKSVIRLKMPAQKIRFDDIIRGKVEFEADLIGDIIIAKDLDAPLYNFSAVVDDFEMKISHVIRGEDHIPNTPKQIIIQEALGFSRPIYGHLPLILGQDKSKLSKRHGAVSVLEFKKEGYLPEALVNMLVFMGWNPGDEREIFSLPALIKEFSFKKVHKGGAVFNIKKLDSLNGFYIRQKSLDKLTELCLPYLIESKLITPSFEEQERFPDFTGIFGKEIIQKDFFNETKEKISFEQIKKIVRLYQERLKNLSEISELTDFFFKEKIQYDKELLCWKEMGDREVGIVVDRLIKTLSEIKEKDWSANNLEEVLLKEAEKLGAEIKMVGDRGHLLWPLRTALTGKQYSAGPFDIAEVLGKDKTIKRLEEARAMF